ncbi:hypothetical protein [Flavisolibacter tropicus]|uniref:Uncharacterized protein n=1 Tax=Flavisolibacter tropicus TaxID=1492898 RepID=A0A172TTC3_9BACT|nr:hypothetical protein [Flavisolibacter tropicus]ANE50351.1 hypothetical protein SY85_07420 [Flavisolibacter tropicus]
MEYKLIRGLSIVLQAGIIILLAMLISLLLFSCKTNAKQSTANSKTTIETQKDMIEKRFLNEIQKHRIQIKALCLTQQAKAQLNPS